jgi:hypothetical protein
MGEPITFDESDWRELTGHDKKALRIFSRVAIGFEPLAKHLASARRAWMR